MSYFKQFNYVLYPDFVNNNQYLILKNITSRVIRKLNVLDDKSVYYNYTIKEQESIEDVSYNLYGSPNYYWILMLINNRFDKFYDFPLQSKQFDEMILEKYGSVEDSQSQLFSFFVRTDSLQYSSDDSIDASFFYEVNEEVYLDTPEYIDGILMRKSKSKYDIELEANENKRNILVLNSSYLNNFLTEFNSLIK